MNYEILLLKREVRVSKMENQLILQDDILELEGIDWARENVWLTYRNGENNPVPRVTKIIAHNRDNEFLVNLACNIGGRKFMYYREKALTVGTIVHENIDNYLRLRYINRSNEEYTIDYQDTEIEYRSSIFNAVTSFKEWDKHLNSLGIYIEEVIGIEVGIFCPWYGGTADAILKINGAIYLVDFKTSKQISPDYLIQASAYMWMINNGYCPLINHIDGIGIIRVDKQRIKFNDLFLNSFDINQNNFILRLQEAFASYVNSYYRTMNTDFMFNEYIKQYPIIHDTDIFPVKPITIESEDSII